MTEEHEIESDVKQSNNTNEQLAPDCWKALNAELRQLRDHCGPRANKNDLALVLSAACIEAGINTVGRIIKVLVPLGLDRRHLGVVLTQRRDGWFRQDSEGVLSLVPE